MHKSFSPLLPLVCKRSIEVIHSLLQRIWAIEEKIIKFQTRLSSLKLQNRRLYYTYWVLGVIASFSWTLYIFMMFYVVDWKCTRNDLKMLIGSTNKGFRFLYTDTVVMEVIVELVCWNWSLMLKIQIRAFGFFWG